MYTTHIKIFLKRVVGEYNHDTKSQPSYKILLGVKAMERR